MHPQTRQLLTYLHALPHEAFSIAGRLDDRRYLARVFPAELPLQLALQKYPAYRRMVGEKWLHWHDYYELWVATDGGGRYRIGEHLFAFAPGDVVLVDPLKLHGVHRMESGHAPLVVLFPREAVAAVDLQFLAAWDRRPKKVVPRLAADAPAAGAVHGALLHLAQAWFGPAGAQRGMRVKFHLLELLLRLGEAFGEQGSTAALSPPVRAEREEQIGRVLEYMAQHCEGKLSQPAVARRAGMSTSRFRRFFKETTGWGFADYLRDLRLERAARLLRETGESLAHVAGKTGFADQSHLQRLFKGKYGCTPLAYRKAQQQEPA